MKPILCTLGLHNWTFIQKRVWNLELWCQWNQCTKCSVTKNHVAYIPKVKGDQDE